MAADRQADGIYEADGGIRRRARDIARSPLENVSSTFNGPANFL
jgi:hypothetical protein